MTDNFDDFVASAFEEFDAAERATGPAAPGVDAIRHTIAHQRRARMAGVTAAVALSIAVPVTVYTALPWGNNSPPTGGRPATSVPASPGQSATASPSASPSAPGVTVSLDDVRNATLDLPPFPQWEPACKAAGTHTFVNGTATTDRSTDPATTLGIGAWPPIMADLDGVPGDEALTTIRCDNPASVHVVQLLALKVAGDGKLTAMGYVINSPDAANMTAEFGRSNIVIDNGVVKLTVYGPYQTNGWPPCDRQVRGYAWRDGHFRQVSGPTAFVKPPTDYHQVDFRNTGLLLGYGLGDGNGTTMCVPMHNGAAEADIQTGSSAADVTHYTVTIGTVRFVQATDGEATFALFTMVAAGGATVQTLQTFVHGADNPLGWEILRSGTRGVSAIEKVETSSGVVQVTVMTAGGRQVWSYRPSALNQTWQRID